MPPRQDRGSMPMQDARGDRATQALPHAQPIPCSTQRGSPVPDCGSERIARIGSGEPPGDADFEADVRAGRVVLGEFHRPRGPSPPFAADPAVWISGWPGRTQLRQVWASPCSRRELVPSTRRPGPWRIGRLVLTGSAARSEAHRLDLLVAAVTGLARGKATVRYLLTPAGFIDEERPIERDVKPGWETSGG